MNDSTPHHATRRFPACLLLIGGLLGWKGAMALSAPSEPVRADAAATALDPHLKQPASTQKALPRPYRIELPAAPAKKRRVGRRPDGAIRIGIARAIPKAAQSLQEKGRLNWTSSADGGHFARVEVATKGAVGIRFKLEIIALPARSELRFYAPNGKTKSGDEAIDPTTGGRIHHLLGQNFRAHPDEPTDLGYWSPVIPGERAGVEIYLPAGIDPAKVELAVSEVSQLLVLPTTKDLQELNASGFCQEDIACQDATWVETGTSVAKMVYVENGESFLCTGTLINDLDNSTQTPLFLSAEHCISDQTVASSLITYWFFRRAECFGSAPTSVISRSGGAQMLAHEGFSDFSLMKLLDTPPNGARFAAWTTDRQTINSSATAIHHPSGDLKKISFGRITDIADAFGAPSLDKPLNVNWNLGTTEPGSSGSPLFNTTKQLVGTLWGGASNCTNRGGTDFYGRFELTGKAIENILRGNASDPARISTLASRAWVGTGDDVVIAGIETVGTGEAKIVARGAGPSLANAGLNGVLNDPEIQLFSGPTLLADNDSWRDTANVQRIIDAGLGLDDPKEAAIYQILPAGPYTVILRGGDGGAGIGGLAVDDLELPDNMRLQAIATRAFVDGGDKVLIAGFRISGGEKSVVLRGFGPTMGSTGLTGLLRDPVLEVFSGSQKIGENDDWRSTSSAGLIQAVGLAPDNELESAILMTLAPGDYTVVVKGFQGETGIAGVAVNELP